MVLREETVLRAIIQIWALCFSKRNCLNSRALVINFTVSWFILDRKKWSFCSSLYSNTFSAALSSHLSLRYAYDGQWNRKCISVSTHWRQKWQKRSSFGIFLCLPFSISKTWFESLNFATCDRFSIFLIFTKYFSMPISVLKSEYVLSLHPSFLMFSK